MNFIKEHFNKITTLIFTITLSILTFMKKDLFLSDTETGILLIAVECVLLLSLFALAFFSKKSNKAWISWLIFLLTPLCMECAVELLNGNMLWDIDMFGNILMNYFINLLLYLFVFSISGNMKLSICSVSVFLEAFGIANMYVKRYKGGPLLPWDLSAIKTAQKVSSAFKFNLTTEIIVSISIVVVIWKLSNFCMKNPKTKCYRIVRGASAALWIAFIIIFYGTDIPANVFGATPDFFNQTRGYEAKGAVAEFLINTKYLHLSKPDAYDPQTLETKAEENTNEDDPTILETALKNEGYSEEEIEEQTSTKSDISDPNIIVIMNESFSDLSVIGDFDTTEEYMPFINSLKDTENCISGYSYVSTIGTGTSNTEYEFLTGNSMAFLPVGSNAYQLYIKNEIPSLVSSLQDQNYSLTAFHPYYKQNWNRENVYEYMGFESYLGQSNFSDLDKIRLFVSDESDFEHVEQLYEERDTSKPFFLFNVTMQNHSSYDQTDENWYQQIKLANMSSTYPETEQYLSLIKETDDAFSDLISYFNAQEEPTIILMFGDHQPYIEDAFYEEVMGKSLNELTDAEQQKRYITRFVLWANYDIPEGWIEKISVNYLSTLLAQVSNTELTDYQKFLNSLYTKVPVVTMMGCIDWNQKWFSVNDQNPYSEILNIYDQLCYNNIIDTTNRCKKLFYLKKEKQS